MRAHTCTPTYTPTLTHEHTVMCTHTHAKMNESFKWNMEVVKASHETTCGICFVARKSYAICWHREAFAKVGKHRKGV